MIHVVITRKGNLFMNNVKQLYQRLVAGDRYSLSKAITLVESTRTDHQKMAQQLLSLILKPSTGAAPTNTTAASESIQTKYPNRLNPPFRIGLSGSPGVGKSTFIEAFGMHLIKQGHQVAVLAVDPSSSMSGGSILGDKTRMARLSVHPSAFIRPTAAGKTLGGVARHTNESILLCEAAGYDVVLVETVGVGQSETMVNDMVDFFTLLVPPNSGDELQGLKKGIVELCDMVIVNKADGKMLEMANITMTEYLSALKYVRRKSRDWSPQVQKVSSVQETGLVETWKTMMDYYNLSRENGTFEERRMKQRKKWMWRHLTEELIESIRSDPNVQKMVNEMEDCVVKGELVPNAAAQTILESFLNHVKRTEEKEN